ncbi:hypothetical protein DID88_000517 [Monilinia fructigena]|uniref:Uncharacterized protein n=1 Tax=Monilinia fructigena TaxID=38457 RepID=A0A395II34_9HELO|nr:hypothetical protein DID88_000517 [Monilinia fructigena]
MPDLYDNDDDDNSAVGIEMLGTPQNNAVDSNVQHNENGLASFVDPTCSSRDLQAVTPIASDVAQPLKKKAKKKRPVPGNSPKARSPARWEVKACKPRFSDYVGERKRHDVGKGNLQITCIWGG